jgi:hypothetical protein
MKKEELKSKIREQILTNLSEKKKKDNVEEPEVEITKDTEEETSTETAPAKDFGVDPKIQTLQNALKAAYDAAKDMGDEKLETQIGNTITYFTRAHIVKKDEGIAETTLKEQLKKLIKQTLNK